jgi:hypothetical protein
VRKLRSIEGSTRKHIIEAEGINEAPQIAADGLTRSNANAGDKTTPPIHLEAVHCMDLTGFLNLEKLKEAFGDELFIEQLS